MKFKRLFTITITMMLISMSLMACSNSTEMPDKSKTQVNPGHVSSLPETAVSIDINTLCSGAGEPNEAGWIPTNVYIDTVKEQYDKNQDENLKLVLKNVETPISTAYIFLGMKFSDDTVTYAYEAIETGTDKNIVVYTEIHSGGATNITTGPISDKDQILLGITNSGDINEESNDVILDITTESTETSINTVD